MAKFYLGGGDFIDQLAHEAKYLLSGVDVKGRDLQDTA